MKSTGEEAHVAVAHRERHQHHRPGRAAGEAGLETHVGVSRQAFDEDRLVRREGLGDAPFDQERARFAAAHRHRNEPLLLAPVADEQQRGEIGLRLAQRCRHHLAHVSLAGQRGERARESGVAALALRQLGSARGQRGVLPLE